MQFADTHAHLNFDVYDKDRDKVINNSFKKGVKFIINIGIDKQTSLESIKLAKKYKKIYASAGWHPHEAESFQRDELLKLLDHREIVALGEIGLDFYRNLSSPSMQKEVFCQQLSIANEKQLPVIIHDRNAHKEIMELLEKYKPKKVVFHCYSGNLDFAREIIEKGWFVSLTGIVTFDPGKYYPLIKEIPLNKFFLETDAPFLTPVPFRGKRNKPEYVTYIIDKIAEIKNQTPVYIADITTQNAEQFFSISTK